MGKAEIMGFASQFCGCFKATWAAVRCWKLIFRKNFGGGGGVIVFAGGLVSMDIAKNCL